MASVISLHKRQVFLLDGTTAAYANLSVYESGTTTQVPVYAESDLLNERSQPVAADANGVFPVCYVAGSAALTLVVTDEHFNDLPGYPMDNITPEPTGTSRAEEISFTPIEGLTETTVQAAIEATYAEAAGQADIVSARFTPFVTGGSGNAYTLTPTPTVTTYAAGQSWIVRPDRANTGAATLNVDGLGARSIMKYNTSGVLAATSAGDIEAYREFLAYDDGTQIVMLLGRDFPLKTTGANGTSTRFADGTQICRLGKLTLTAASAGSSVTGTWTFPQAFANTTDLVVTAMLRPASYSDNSTAIIDGAPGVALRTSLTSMAYGQTSTTSTTIRVHSTDDFAIADELYLSVKAEGNWR